MNWLHVVHYITRISSLQWQEERKCPCRQAQCPSNQVKIDKGPVDGPTCISRLSDASSGTPDQLRMQASRMWQTSCGVCLESVETGKF